ncbi:hypothetical protein IAT38_004436 [Cryptococcus sp. DSM 104549]
MDSRNIVKQSSAGDSHRLDFDTIQRGCRQGELVVRVFDQNSASPLTSSGFICSADKDKIAYPGNVWSSPPNLGPFPRSWRPDDLVEMGSHITGGYAGHGGGGATSFISATEDLEWAVWEVVRRLRVEEMKEASMCVIKTPPKPRDKINARWMVDHAQLTELLGQRGGKGPRSCGKALDLAVPSSEVLFYKVIPKRHIAHTFRWSLQDETPIDLPDYFFDEPREEWEPHYWRHHLVWQRGVWFGTAQDNLEHRRRELQRQ